MSAEYNNNRNHTTKPATTRLVLTRFDTHYRNRLATNYSYQVSSLPLANLVVLFEKSEGLHVHSRRNQEHCEALNEKEFLALPIPSPNAQFLLTSGNFAQLNCLLLWASNSMCPNVYRSLRPLLSLPLQEESLMKSLLSYNLPSSPPSPLAVCSLHPVLPALLCGHFWRNQHSSFMFFGPHYFDL